MGMMGERANVMAKESENDATHGLITSYSSLNTSTPIRTPMAPASEDRIANEIKNIRALTETQSSLLGGENKELRDGSGSTGFESVAPRQKSLATPNPLATPLRSAVQRGATPSRPGQTPMRTPRDSFALNSAAREICAAGSGTNDMKLSELALRKTLNQGLSSLPKPKQTEFSLATPEDQEETGPVEDTPEEDAAERERRQDAILKAREALERRRQTQVMQRGLPRPRFVDVDSMLHHATVCDKMSKAQSLIAREAAILIAHDAAKFPLPGSKVVGKVPLLRSVDDSLIAEAKLQIMVETKEKPSMKDIAALWQQREGGSRLIKLGLTSYGGETEKAETVVLKGAFDVSCIHPLCYLNHTLLLHRAT